METKRKLALLELVAGLFGWVWIVASVAALYFVAIALFSDGSWWNVIWAIVIGAVGKWLSRGFSDNQKRVAYETELIERGFTPEDAGRAWTQAYLGGPNELARLRQLEDLPASSPASQAEDRSPK